MQTEVFNSYETIGRSLSMEWVQPILVVFLFLLWLRIYESQTDDDIDMTQHGYGETKILQN